jgi:glycosyltransferase involved in cell wall biosynthesis
LVTIITINLNNLSGLKRTIESVINQTWKEFEYILVDGGSTDGSAEYIAEMENHFAYWVSEPDTGIYDAMNKGIKVASGEYLLFLNSGDRLINGNVLLYAQNLLKVNSGYFVHSLRCSDSGEIENGEIKKKAEVIGINTFLKRGSIGHPGAFIKRKIMGEDWRYNEQNKIVSDWEFFLELYIKHPRKFKRYNYLLTIIEDGGISRNPSLQELRNLERTKAIQRLSQEHIKLKFILFLNSLSDSFWINKLKMIKLQKRIVKKFFINSTKLF